MSVPEDDEDLKLLDTTHTRLLMLSVLFAWIYFIIFLRLVNVIFEANVPHLTIFTGGIFASLLLIYTFRRFLTKIYMKVVDRSILRRLSDFLTKQQIKENAIAVQMLRSKIERNTIPKLISILSICAYVMASILFRDFRLSIGGLITLIIVFVAITGDEVLLGYRLSRNNYADNEYEIRELLSWIIENTDPRRNRHDPPLRILPTIEPTSRRVFGVAAPREQ